MGQLAILKTIAAFMNSEGGTLIVGVDDSGNILGVEKDYETFSDNIVLIESSQSVGTLKREGLVEDHDMTKNQDEKKSLKVAHYTITPKGLKLLQGWLAFLSAFQ